MHVEQIAPIVEIINVSQTEAVRGLVLQVVMIIASVYQTIVVRDNVLIHQQLVNSIRFPPFSAPIWGLFFCLCVIKKFPQWF